MCAAGWLCAVATAQAFAQDGGQASATPAATETPKGKDLTLSVAYKPAFGRDIQFEPGDRVVDDGSLEGDATLKFGLGADWKLEFKVGVTSAPEMFDDDAPSSTLYGGAKIKGKISAWGDWAVVPYAEVTRSASYSQYLEGWQFTDLNLDLGGELKNNASDAKGKRWEYGFSTVFKAVDSSKEDRDRAGFLIRTRLERWFSGKVGLYSKASYEVRYFTIKPPAGDPWIDRLFDHELGVSFKKFLPFATPDIGLELGAKFRRRWSNDSTREYDRVFFVPALTAEF